MDKPFPTSSHDPDASGLLGAHRSEDKLLALCARRPHAHKHRRLLKEMVNGFLDWDYVLFQAFSHGLTPSVYGFLKENVWDQVPAAAQRQLSKYIEEIGAKNLRLSGELVRITEALSREGIKCVPFKGPVLTRLLYGEEGLRQYDDLDILIDGNTIGRAKSVLETMGYEIEKPLSPAQEKAYLRSECEYHFRHTASGISVELHWAVMPSYFSSRFEFPSLLLTEEDKLNKSSFCGICAEDLLLLLCVHSGIKHFFDRISFLSDIAALYSTQSIDWTLVRARAQVFQCKRVLWMGLSLCRGICDYTLPDFVEKEMKQDGRMAKAAAKIKCRFFQSHPKPLNVWGQARYHLQMTDTWQGRIRYCARLFWYPTIYDWKSVRFPDKLYFLYYISRPLRLLGKGLRAVFLGRARPS